MNCLGLLMPILYWCQCNTWVVVPHGMLVEWNDCCFIIQKTQWKMHKVCMHKYTDFQNPSVISKICFFSLFVIVNDAFILFFVNYIIIINIVMNDLQMTSLVFSIPKKKCTVGTQRSQATQYICHGVTMTLQIYLLKWRKEALLKTDCIMKMTMMMMIV